MIRAISRTPGSCSYLYRPPSTPLLFNPDTRPSPSFRFLPTRVRRSLHQYPLSDKQGNLLWRHTHNPTFHSQANTETKIAIERALMQYGLYILGQEDIVPTIRERDWAAPLTGTQLVLTPEVVPQMAPPIKLRPIKTILPAKHTAYSHIYACYKGRRALLLAVWLYVHAELAHKKNVEETLKMLVQKAIKEGNFQAESVGTILQLGNTIMDYKFVSGQLTERGLLRGMVK